MKYEKGATVRQYHDSTRLRYDDAVIKFAHQNGALDVIGLDGCASGWSVDACEVIKAAPETPAKTEKAPRRTLLQRLFGGGLGRPLINLWVEERVGEYGQRHVETRLKLGRHTVLRWECIRNDMDEFDRS